MNNKKKIKIIPILFSVFFFLGANLAHPFSLGKTYDSSNWQDIEKKLPLPFLKWVKNGELIINTEKLNFNYMLNERFLEASKRNIDLFELNDNGFVIQKENQKRVQFIYAFPFHDIDSQDLKAAEKIVHNFNLMRWRNAASTPVGRVSWIGRSGKEREVIAGGKFLSFQGRPEGPIPNPNNFLALRMQYVMQPYDVRGLVQMSWEYDDEREDTAFAYIPMLRRVTRVSSSASSDPFLGSDLCADDAYLWAGKAQSMTWKLIETSTVLCPFSHNGIIKVNDLPDGSVRWYHPKIKFSFEVPDHEVSQWSPISLIWSPRNVYIIEGFPKDPYYNYGKQLFYVDMENFVFWFKLIYSKAGVYWKSVYAVQSYQISEPSGRTNVGYCDYFAVDDRNHHASLSEIIKWEDSYDRSHIPYGEMNPQHFTVNAIYQLTK